MIRTSVGKTPTILFGVTSSQSIKLLGRIPDDMVEMGWDVHVVAGDTPSQVPKSMARVKFHRLPMVRNPSPVKDIFSLVSWMGLLKRIRPKIVVLGTPKVALVGLLASLLCRVPVRVYQLRGLRLETTSGPLRYALRFLEWITAKCSTSILAVSNSLKDQYCRLGLSQCAKIEVLGFGSSHGVDVEYFNPNRWSGYRHREPVLRRSIKLGLPIVGFVGRFSKDKGAQEILHACRSLLESGVEHTMLIIGPIEGGEESLRALKRINPHTVITGPLEDVAPYYPIMALLVLPTHREGFPNTVLEAAASGIPTVTTSATGAVDSVIDRQTGLIVPPGDGPAFARAVISLVTDPELARTLGTRARMRSVAHFDEKHVSINYINYLKQLTLLSMRPELSESQSADKGRAQLKHVKSEQSHGKPT